MDTSAFIAGFDPFSISEEEYTVPLVRSEITGNSMAWVRFKTAVDSGKLKVVTPKRIFMDKVKAAAKVVGDKFFLSDADLQVLALALELKTKGYSPLVATDDYSIQNVANQMKIKFASLATFGIRFRLEWVRYCPACHRRYPSDYKFETCEVCGTRLKRKPVRKRLLKTNKEN
ncbi:ribonuclease VapC [Candidatus Bathyarchaeota archaeon]|nr:MAG: ribonuclease VapC [Candidatus Bathyarchaeota archaeon]